MLDQLYAMQIDRENYPLALALLGGFFAEKPIQTVIHDWVVINQPRQMEGGDGYGGTIVLDNLYVRHDDFQNTYEILKGIQTIEGFVAVEFIPDKREVRPFVHYLPPDRVRRPYRGR